MPSSFKFPVSNARQSLEPQKVRFLHGSFFTVGTRSFCVIIGIVTLLEAITNFPQK